MGWVGFNPRRIFLQYAGSVAPSKSSGRSHSARVEKFTCAAVTPNLIPSPPQTLSLHLPSTRPLHQTTAAQRRAPHLRQGCAAPASPSAGPAWSAAPTLPGPPRPRSRPAAPEVPPRPPPGPPEEPPARRPLPWTGAALCPGSLQVSTSLVLFCCYFFIAISLMRLMKCREVSGRCPETREGASPPRPPAR